MTPLTRTLVAAVALVVAAPVAVGTPADAATYTAHPRTTKSIRSIEVDNGPRTLHLTATQRANGSGVLAFEWAINVDRGKKREFTVYTYENSSDVILVDADFDHVACKGIGYTKKGRTVSAAIPKRCLGRGVGRLQVQVDSTYQRHAGRGDCVTESVPAHGYSPFISTASSRRMAAREVGRTTPRPAASTTTARRGC